jgi:flagellar basal-body rod protein FlgB
MNSGMNVDNIGLFSALKSRMSWLGQRQKVVAENVANASTPGFKPKDLKKQDFAAMVSGADSMQDLGLKATNAGHIATDGPPGAAQASRIKALDSETTLDGNSVVLEEQMIKMADSRMQFEAAVGFYQKSMEMLRTASKLPGR